VDRKGLHIIYCIHGLDTHYCDPRYRWQSLLSPAQESKRSIHTKVGLIYIIEDNRLCSLYIDNLVIYLYAYLGS